MINMAKKNKIQMPSGQGGLIRYFESEKETIKLRPEHVIVICVIIIAAELVLKFGILG